MSRAKTRLKWGLASFVILLGVSFFLMLIWRYHSSEDSIKKSLAAASPYLAVWRYSFIITVVAAWGPIARWLTRKHPVEAQTQLVSQRWRIAAWLVVLELVLVQNVFGKMLSMLMR